MANEIVHTSSLYNKARAFEAYGIISPIDFYVFLSMIHIGGNEWVEIKSGFTTFDIKKSYFGSFLKRYNHFQILQSINKLSLKGFFKINSFGSLNYGSFEEYIFKVEYCTKMLKNFEMTKQGHPF